MRLERNELIAGYPAKTIRQFLRHLGGTQGAGVKFAAYYLEMDGATVTTVLSKLTAEGLIESGRNHSNEPIWMNTVKGNAVGLAKFRKPIPRDKATRILKTFLARVTCLNADPYFFIGVEKIEVFGSYLSEVACVNDIDLFVHYDFKPSISRSDRVQLSQDRIRLAERNGRQFRNISDEVCWPTREVELYIRARESRLSLHHSSDGIIDVVEKMVVYTAPWS